MKDTREGSCCITGATGGIGLELAKLFAEGSSDLVLVARDVLKLNRISENLTRQFGITVTVIATDLSSVSAPAEIHQQIRQKGIVVDTLVNAAGVGLAGFFFETDRTRETEMMLTNMVGFTNLTKLFVKDMISRRRGRILNVAAMAAFRPGPLTAVYAATKAYVLALSEALSSELEGTGVTVTALCPGPTDTEFHKRSLMQHTRQANGKRMSAAAVARAGYDALMKGKTVAVPGLANKIGLQRSRFSTRKGGVQSARRLNERSG